MFILSVNTSTHDAGAAIFNDFNVLAAIQEERTSRVKGIGGIIPKGSLDEVFEQTGVNKKDIDVLVLCHGQYPSRYFKNISLIRKALKKIERKKFNLSSVLGKEGTTKAENILDTRRLAVDLGLREDVKVHFYNHHRAHALSALAYTDWEDAFLYTADAGGDNIQYSHHLFRQESITTLYGTNDAILEKSKVDSIGAAYGYVTQALGFVMNRHEGKLTGLAAYGKPELYDEFKSFFTVNCDGVISTSFTSYKSMQEKLIQLSKAYIQSHSNEFEAKADLAASIQKLLETVVVDSLKQLQKKHHFKNLGLAGGVFANVKLNRHILEELNLKEIFVFPGMGDEGLVIGGIHDYLISHFGISEWSRNRARLQNVYWGKNYDDEFSQVFSNDANVVRKDTSSIAKDTAKLLSEGKVVAIYKGRMEFGPRALGARTIMASPRNNDVNISINERLQRTEFMPFAPFVLEEDAHNVFDIDSGNKYASRFMTITTQVKDEWLNKIPAVVHIDKSARPQIINSSENRLYADILTEFKLITGLPVLVNTSFNAHEEPIINTPHECLRALKSDRVDYVVHDSGIYSTK